MSARVLGTFVAAGPRSAKLRCEVCGASGYPGGAWMAKHLTHDELCTECGAELSNRGALGQHRRQNHPDS